MDSYKSIQEIQKDYDRGCYACRITIPKRFSEDHIFDENLSVKKNREMVLAHNLKAEKIEQESRKKSSKLSQKFYHDIIYYIMHEYHLNKEQAELVETYVHSEGHGFVPDYFSHIDTIAAFAEVISRLHK